MVHAGRLCAQANGGDESVVLPFTSRPPVQPAPLGIFARGEDE
jgi:hypothetical protein